MEHRSGRGIGMSEKQRNESDSWTAPAQGYCSTDVLVSQVHMENCWVGWGGRIHPPITPIGANGSGIDLVGAGLCKLERRLTSPFQSYCLVLPKERSAPARDEAGAGCGGGGYGRRGSRISTNEVNDRM